MSINKVMILNPFILLPDEVIRYETPTLRTLFVLQLQNSSSSREIKSIGKLYLSNKRLVVISEEGDYQSLNILLNQVKSFKFGASVGGGGGGSSFFKQLIFGANRFEILILTSSTDRDIGLSPQSHYLLTIQFNDGGIYDFSKKFEQMYNNLINDQPIDEVDQLPAYSE